MGDVVRFWRPDPERLAYEAEVRRLCGLAKVDDLAPEFLAACTPIEIVADHCLWIALRRKPPTMIARAKRRLTGPAGTRRRDLPKSPTLYRRS